MGNFFVNLIQAICLKFQPRSALLYADTQAVQLARLLGGCADRGTDFGDHRTRSKIGRVFTGG